MEPRDAGLTFYEAPAFMRARDEYFLVDDGFRQMQNALIAVPDAGNVIPGCGGLRKMRWGDATRGKGKRGGLRVIYLLVPEALAVVLFAIYDKDLMSDLTPEQKRDAVLLAAQARSEVLKLHGLYKETQ